MTDTQQLAPPDQIKLDKFINKMRSRSLSEECIAQFELYFKKVLDQETGYIPEAAINPVPRNSVPSLESIQHHSSNGIKLLAKTAVLKLNGGLGTTMGCQGPKSLITVRNGYSFLQIIINNLLQYQKKYGVTIPLILMNSFATEEQSVELLNRYPELRTPIPNSFTQNMFPKILDSTFDVPSFPANNELEWNPAGHGDVYASLGSSGILDELLKSGYHYIFISNSDNLNAYPDPAIPGYMHATGCQFLMEITERTPADQKGGHVACRRDGGFVLREISQCPSEDLDSFRDIEKHCFFNTNNIWIDIRSLKKLLEKNDGYIPLPMICNRKHLDPVDNTSPAVIQLESAMGSILPFFTDTALLEVPRTRFSPVKSSADLLYIRSDLYELTDDFQIRCLLPQGTPLPPVDLDKQFFLTVSALEQHFPEGLPSLVECSGLSVRGDVIFGKSVKIVGKTEIAADTGIRFTIPDNSVLSGSYHYSD